MNAKKTLLTVAERRDGSGPVYYWLELCDVVDGPAGSEEYRTGRVRASTRDLSRRERTASLKDAEALLRRAVAAGLGSNPLGRIADDGSLQGGNRTVAQTLERGYPETSVENPDFGIDSV